MTRAAPTAAGFETGAGGGGGATETPATGTGSTEAGLAGCDDGLGIADAMGAAAVDAVGLDEAPPTGSNTGAAGAAGGAGVVARGALATVEDGDKVRRWPGQIV
jgi:hypothetical protein